MEEMKASMLIMSHLSDAQELVTYAVDSINFAKFVLMKHPNTNDIVDADKLS